MRRLLPVLVCVGLFGLLAVSPVTAKGGSDVSFTLQGQVVGLERSWDGGDMLHFRGSMIAGVVFGDLQGTAFVESSTDVDATTGAGNHRGQLTIVTADGSISGRFQGSTTGFIQLQGQWVATHGTGALAGMQIRADYVGLFFDVGELQFTGRMK